MRQAFVLRMAAVATVAALAATAVWAQSARVLTLGSGSFLGVSVAEIDSERAKSLNLKEEHGVAVTRVEPGGPAEKAGVKVGDVVLEYNGQRIEGTEQFIRMVRETPVSRQVKLLVLRGGAQQTLTATIGSRKGSTMMVTPEVRIPEIRVPEVQIDIPRAYMSWRSSSLGVEAESLESQLAEYFGVKQGVLVRSVIKGSAADKAGLKAGDVIQKVDDARVSSPREVSSAIRALGEKRTFPLTVMREKREVTMSVTLDEENAGRERRTIERRTVRKD